MTPVEVRRGNSPVILGMPHTGTFLPEEIRSALNENGLNLADTDWHIDRLYDGLLDDVTIVRATFHRYVIDANRDPSGASLYPGQNTTGLVPATDFDNAPIWREGHAPDDGEIAARRAAFHRPYHNALENELARIHDRHGVAVLYDCHSIRSLVPFLFKGRLPDFNIGDNDGVTCDPVITSAVEAICAAANGYSHVLNGRFKGGWTTRHYGRPADGFHAIQMELAQATHLASETPPFAYDPQKAQRLRVLLGEILQAIEKHAINRLASAG